MLGHRGNEDPTILKNKNDMTLNEEMAQQIKANNIRIAVLEEQNTSLRETLSKYEEYHDKIPSQIVSIFKVICLHLVKYINKGHVVKIWLIS